MTASREPDPTLFGAELDLGLQRRRLKPRTIGVDVADMTLAITASDVAAVLAIIGTGMQAGTTLQDMKRQEPDAAEDARLIDEMRDEVSSWHPVKRRRHRAAVKEVIGDSPEYAAWRRIQWRLYGWSVLLTGAVFAAAAHFSQK